MGAVLRLAAKELRKKKFYSLLLFTVCLLAMYMTITSVTNATSAAWQQKLFESSLGLPMETVLHLDYHDTKESDAFTAVLAGYREYIAGLPGVRAVGQFDAAGMFFSELRVLEPYLEINSKIVSGGRYAACPEITQLLSVDAALLPLVKGGVSAYTEPTGGHLPIYASEVFREILPAGTLLTAERTGEIYEVAGYFARGSVWVNENDLIRFPMEPMDGWFIAPFSAGDQNDILTQLSCLHNTYVLIEDHADIAYLKQAIHKYSVQHDFEATANTLAEEYAAYRAETEPFIRTQTGLAVLISAMAVSCIIAVFTTNALLKRRQYGILIANGFTLTEIALCITAEIAWILFFSIPLAWGAKLAELLAGADLFRDVLLTAHFQFALPACLGMGVLLVTLSAAIPAARIFRYQPCELIGGNSNGND